MIIVGFILGITSFFTAELYAEQPIGLLDKNIAEYNCSLEGGLESVSEGVTICGNGTIITTTKTK